MDMKLWAKISSIVSIIYVGIFYFSSSFTYFFLSLIGIFPLFYFGFFKNINNKYIRVWGKFQTIILPIIVIVYLIIYPSIIILDWALINIISILPLYYFCWFRDYKIKIVD